MPTTAAIIAGTGASVAGIGTAAWTNPGNITASDDTRATVGIAGAVSRWLAASQFDFSSIPDDAVVLGVTGTVEASIASGSGTITAATLFLAGAPVGAQKTLSTALTGTDANYTIGGANDLWGYNLTPAVLKTSTFGLGVSMTGVGVTSARVDAMWLTVDYGYNGFRIRVTTSTLSNRNRRPLMAVRS